MLRNDGMMVMNLPKHMLGRNDCASAIELLIRTNIEIVPIDTYKTWLREEWGIDSSTRINELPKVLRMEDLDETLRRRMDDLCEQDCKLHEHIMNVWSKVGGTRVFGSDLLRD